MILLSASGSGKSYFSKGKSDIIDGDDVINDTIGWPDDPEWFLRDDAYVAIVHEMNAAALHTYVKANPTKLVVFNGPVRMEDLFGIVEIPEKDHKDNLWMREESGGLQPTDWELIKENRKEIRTNFGQVRKLQPYWPSFASAYDSWRRSN